MGKRKWQGILVLLLTFAVCWPLIGYGAQTGAFNWVWVMPLYVAGLVFGVVLLVAGRKKAE